MTPDNRRKAPHIRWMIRVDMPEVMEIEALGFQEPWTLEDFQKVLAQQNTIGMVAELSERVVGFMVFEMHRTRYELINLAVHPDWRLQGIGRALVHKMISKLSPTRRDTLAVNVGDVNLSAHLFFRACGLTATEVVWDAWDEGVDAYRFCCRVEEVVHA